MIKLNYGELNNPVLGDAITRLSQQNGFASAKASYNVSRIVRQLDTAVKKARTEFVAFSEKFAKKDDTGKTVPSITPGPLPFELKEETKEQFESELAEFFKTETTLESNKITMADLGTIVPQPADFITLEPFITDLVALDASEVPGQNVLPFPPEQSPSH